MTEHLGGWMPGGDEATWFPDLWRWLVDEHDVGSVIDVGCGDAVAADFFCGLGCDVVGVDGDPAALDAVIARWQSEDPNAGHPTFTLHDYTTGKLDLRARDIAGSCRVDGFDLAWCCEFVEHVEERYVPNFLETFREAPLLLMTHAVPGQGGHHHVNCRTADYWIGALAAVGFALDGELTHDARGWAASNASPWNHFIRSGLAFRRAA